MCVWCRRGAYPRPCPPSLTLYPNPRAHLQTSMSSPTVMGVHGLGSSRKVWYVLHADGVSLGGNMVMLRTSRELTPCAPMHSIGQRARPCPLARALFLHEAA